MGLTLLERLEAADEGGPTPALSRRSDPSVTAASILANLNRVLNSRANCCETRRDYGLPDFNDFINRFPDAIPALSRAVKREIEEFEPRLRQVQVKHVPDPDQPLSLSFHIEATFELEGQRHTMAVDTVLNDDGYVTLRG